MATTLPLPTRQELAQVFNDPATLLMVERVLQEIAQVVPDELTALENLGFVLTAPDTAVAPNGHVITQGANISVVVTAGLVTLTATPSGTNGQIQYNNAGAFGGGNLSGDVSTSGSLATTLATVNADVGTFGDATHVAQVTVDAKGRVTAVNSIAIAGGGGGGLWIGLTPPSNPTSYPFWWVSDASSSSAGRLKVYYTDTNGSQWVDATPVQPGPTGPQGPAGPTGGTQAIDFAMQALCGGL